MNVFFSSDLHLGHANILKYQSETRPFSSIEEMDEHIIQVWNNTVKPNDEVYILGDLSFHKLNKTVEILNRLSGKNFYLIAGNHDYKLLKHEEFCEKFSWIKIYNEEKICGENFVMMHYPISSWNRKHWGSHHIHGHCHGKPTDVSGRIKDVGWDTRQGLYSAEEIVEEMKSIPF